MDGPAIPPKTYRLIGIGADGSRHVIAGGMTAVGLADSFMEFMDSREYGSLAVEEDRPATRA
jgi:hypothetical protein